jgi:hypothetical protein
MIFLLKNCTKLPGVIIKYDNQLSELKNAGGKIKVPPEEGP